MANPDTPFGLRPVGNINGSPYNGAVMRCYTVSTDATALYVGDPVIWAGTGDPTGQCPTVTKATAGKTNKITGVIVGFDPDPNNISYTYRAASTNRYCSVVLATAGQLFEIQGCSGAALGITTVGLNGELIYTHSGSTATGRSGVEMDSGASTAPDADATGQLTIVGFVKRADNDFAYANGKWLVVVNLPSISPGIAGV